MSKVSPFHSVLQSDRQVYHNNSSCTDGKDLKKENVRPGEGGRPQCADCKKLN